MATLFGCGFECGIVPHWTQVGTVSLITSGQLSGLRSIQCAFDGSGTDTPSVTSKVTYGAGILVLAGRFQFTQNVSNNKFFFGITIGVNNLGCRVTTSGNVRTIVGSTVSPTGVQVGNDPFWVTMVINTTADPWTAEARVIPATPDYHAVTGALREYTGVASQSFAATTLARAIDVGWPAAGPTAGTIICDDIQISTTLADYELPNRAFHAMVPVADGTHNIAGTGDFQRGNTGTDILNATTTAYQLIDDVPLPTGAVDEADNWRAVAPPNATDYPESVFGPIANAPFPLGPPSVVEAVAAHHQISTGVGSSEALLNDNGTTATIFSLSAAAGVTTYRYATAHFTAPPSGGTWSASGAGGNINGLRVRFRCSDANPDQCLDAVMLEVGFNVIPAPKPMVIGQAVMRSVTY